MPTPQEPPTSVPPNTDKAPLKQERSAALIALLATAVILVAGSPCICYLGLGLFQGIHALRTGNYDNPARRPLYKKYKSPKLAPNTYGRPAPVTR